ncbi:hypothetical protein [Nannocystis pusilla]|uniref:hypothetical protein n=1 Tax=Nannocystis pusilla TaxID=889268 RepID=UPI003BF0D445
MPLLGAPHDPLPATPSSSPNGVDGRGVDGSAVDVAFAWPAAGAFRLHGADACVEYSGTTGFSWRG